MDMLKEDIAKQLDACRFIFGESIAKELEDSMSGVYRTIDRKPTANVIPIEWIKEQKDKCFPDSITAITLNHLLTEWERREE